MEDDLKTKMEDNLKKKWITTSTNKNGRQPQVQFKKSTLIGCGIIVN